MAIKYTDDWDVIQESLILSGNALSQDRTRAEDAVKIKFAVESIQHQKRMTELQSSLLRTTKALTGATFVLAFVTAVLVFITALPHCG